MTTEKKNKLKKSIKSQAIKNPNTKFYFLVIMGIGFGIAGMTLPPIGAIDWSVFIQLMTYKKIKWHEFIGGNYRRIIYYI